MIGNEEKNRKWTEVLFLASSHQPTNNNKSKRGDSPVLIDPSLECSHQQTTNRDAIEVAHLHTHLQMRNIPRLSLLGIGQSVQGCKGAYKGQVVACKMRLPTCRREVFRASVYSVGG